MKYFLPTFFFLIATIAFGLVLIVQKLPQKPLGDNGALITYPEDKEHPKIKGFQLSPKSFDGKDFTDFFELNQQMQGSAVGWTGSVGDLVKQGGAPSVVIELAKKYTYTSVISVQSYDRGSGKLLKEFVSGKEDILAFVTKYKPLYFGMGIEVNDLYSKDPAEFAKFVTLFKEYADAIHKVSPKIHVFPSFQLEKLKGLEGGLFGGKNNTDQSDWPLLLQFPTADFIGFTTYPTLIFKNVADIPENYYKEVFSQTTKRVIFTEIGWLRTNSIKNWESSEVEQEAFLTAFNSQVSGERVIVTLWSFLYDQPAAKQPFDSMGLRGNSKKMGDKLSPAENYWKKM